jgi:hypothetical protein
VPLITAPSRLRRGEPSAPAQYRRPAEIVLAGAHGGAGTSTLAALLRPAWDMGVLRRSAPGYGLRSGGRPIVLVSGNTVTAAGSAVAAVTAISETGARVAVLVVVGDGLPEPAEARYRFRVLEGRVGAVVHMPFVPAFRVTGNPLQVSLPRRVRRALAQIRALAQEHASYPMTRPQGRFP